MSRHPYLGLLRISAGLFCLASMCNLTNAQDAPPAQPAQASQDGAQNQNPQYPQGPQRPQYLDLRYDEDWSHIRELKVPPDMFDVVKYITLNHPDWYMSIGGEARIRYDNWHNANFGYTPKEYLNDNMQRYLLHADFHLGKHVRIFTQLQSSLEFGKAGGPWYSDRDTFELHQAFVDFRTSDDPHHYTMLRVGRQEVALGADHFVSTADFFNARRVFDGARLVVGRGKWTWLVDVARPVLLKNGAFDDTPEHGRTSWGGGFFAPNPFTAQGQTGVFYVGLDTKQQLWNRGLGRDQRHSIGARLEAQTRKGFDYAYEFVDQFGTFTPVFGPEVNIRAWAITTDTGYTYTKSQHYPRFGIRSNVTSGDGGSGSLGTFHPLFPDTAYSGRLGLVGPSNVIDLTPAFRFAATRRVYFLSEWTFFWRENTNDGIYSPSLPTIPIETGITGYIAKPGNYSKARYIGNQVAIASQITIDRHLTYTLAYNYFTAGQFLKETPPGKSTGYFVTWVTYRF